MNDIAAKIIVKVYLVSGKEISHIYIVPTAEKELSKLITELVGKTSILFEEKKGYLSFSNPTINYNRDNVEGIEISTLGVKELETLLRKAQAKVGYIK